MTYDLSPTSSTYGQESTNGGGVRDQARQVGSEAKQAGGAVAETAKEQGKEVSREAARQARNLYGEARSQLAGRTSEQQRRAAGSLRSLAEEVRSMAQNGGNAGPVTELAHQAADRVHGVAGWLEEREPGDILAEVRDYARRNPGTFLVGAAVLGVLAGRLTKNISAGDNLGGTGQRAYDSGAGYDPDRTAVIPTPPAPRAVPDAVPPGGYLDPTPGAYADPRTTTSYADPAGGTGQPLPPVTQTDPLPGVPSSGTTRP
ncbi:YfjI family protein [Micromonospora phytophila]|uniref:YfjI family protein n=1 Tax=Micromonospora phytophila TaxID=709888 RepID=UPI00202E960E|nr:YfjI family protein [Micromonospora phytophila]MCM0677850.1 YfjI family protein [Micromonospora phytophila]